VIKHKTHAGLFSRRKKNDPKVRERERERAHLSRNIKFLRGERERPIIMLSFNESFFFFLDHLGGMTSFYLSKI